MVANGNLPVSGMDTYFCICEVSEIEKASSSCLESYVKGRSSPGGSLAWLAKRRCIIASMCFVCIVALTSLSFVSRVETTRETDQSNYCNLLITEKACVKKTDIGERSNRCVCSTMNRISIII